MKFLNVLALATAAAAAKPTVYLIRHGEKPADDSEHGLSAAGVKRAQCLRNVFGAKSSYNIGHIMAQTPQDGEFPRSLPIAPPRLLTALNRVDGSRGRPRDTVAPLAADLGLTTDLSCDRDDADCVADVVKNYTGKGNILIW